MNAYIALELAVLSIALVGERIYHIKGIKRNFSFGTAYLTIVFVTLTLFMGLRGNFATDYDNYKYGFERMKSLPFSAVFSDDEFLFKFLYYILGRLGANAVVFFVVIAAIMMWGYLRFIREYSPSVWLSVLMLLCVGAYFTSANAIRNILAAALYCLAWRFAERGDFKKYCIATVIISMIHFSAVLLIPAYFVLRIKWSRRYFRIAMVLAIALVVTTAAIADDITYFAMNYIYKDYSYGVDFGLGWVSIFKVIAIQAFILWNTHRINLDNPREKCLYNASLLYTMFYLCSMNMAILQRFAYYFGTAHLILVPCIIFRIPEKNKRTLTCLGMVCFLMLYSWLSLKDAEYYLFTG